MNTNLREQIAKAIREAASEQTYWVPGPHLSLVYADAVICELGLVCDEEMDIAPDGKPRFYHRYVTDWKAADE